MTSYSPNALLPGQAQSVQPWIAGQYYGPSGSTGSLTQTGDRVFAVKLDIPYGAVCSRLGVEVMTAGTGAEVIRFGIAKLTSDYGAELLVDAGTVSATGATGFKEVTLGSPFMYPGGGNYYHLYVVQSLTTSVQLRTVTGINERYAHATGTTIIAQSYLQDGVSGAFPSTFTFQASVVAVGAIKARAA